MFIGERFFDGRIWRIAWEVDGCGAATVSTPECAYERAGPEESRRACGAELWARQFDCGAELEAEQFVCGGAVESEEARPVCGLEFGRIMSEESL